MRPGVAPEALAERVDHLRPHGASEPHHPCQWHVVGVVDGPCRRTVGKIGPRRIRERQRQRLAAFVVGIVEHRHRDGLLRLASGEAERPACRCGVRPRRGRAVRCRVVHRHCPGRCSAHRRVGHRQRRLADPSLRGAAVIGEVRPDLDLLVRVGRGQRAGAARRARDVHPIGPRPAPLIAVADTAQPVSVGEVARPRRQRHPHLRRTRDRRLARGQGVAGRPAGHHHGVGIHGVAELARHLHLDGVCAHGERHLEAGFARVRVREHRVRGVQVPALHERDLDA